METEKPPCFGKQDDSNIPCALISPTYDKKKPCPHQAACLETTLVRLRALFKDDKK